MGMVFKTEPSPFSASQRGVQSIATVFRDILLALTRIFLAVVTAPD
jgi:hypothetical protein